MGPQATEQPNPRIERCRKTIACEETDRMPTYIPAIACEVSSRILGRPAVTGTGSLHFAEVAAWADGESAHEEFEQRLLEDLVAIHRALDIDVLRMPWRMNRRPDARVDEHTFLFGDPEGFHTIWRYDPNTADFGPIRSVGDGPTPEQRLEAAIEAAEQETTPGEAAASRQIAELKELQEACNNEFFVVGASAPITIGLSADDLLLLALEPEKKARQAMLQARAAETLAKALLAENMQPVIYGGGDLAGETGPMYSPDSFRRVLLPAYRWAMERTNPLGVHYFFRTDGDIWPLMDMIFSEAGCPGYGETDRDAKMTVAAVRDAFPDLVIWGNVSSVTLTHGSAGDVREQSLQIREEAASRGYFQGCSNAIVKGTPVENVEAMFSVR